VVSPVMWPRFRTRLDRWLNRTLLRRALLPLVESLPAPPIAVTTQPTMAELVGVLPVRRWVYYCVDDFTEWPGLDHATVHRLEERLIDRADTIVAASEALRLKAARRGRTAGLLTHGVELDLWGAARSGDDLPGLHGLERPLVVFWGLLDRRLDLGLLGRLAHDMDQGTILLVGPGEDIDPAVTRLPRLTRLAALAYEQLPALAREAAVLVMPYIDAPVTHAIQPLKLKEYLATGKPVVARDLPAVRAWGDCLDAVATAEEFSAAVRRRLDEGVPDEQLCARARLAAESWDAKADEFERMAVADAAVTPLARFAR
jgi:glycosyltransferase involved in cell wall biosynthesis